MTEISSLLSKLVNKRVILPLNRPEVCEWRRNRAANYLGGNRPGSIIIDKATMAPNIWNLVTWPSSASGQKIFNIQCDKVVRIRAVTDRICSLAFALKDVTKNIDCISNDVCGGWFDVFAIQIKLNSCIAAFICPGFPRPAPWVSQNPTRASFAPLADHSVRGPSQAL